jgi:hypothetical protein
MNRTGPTNCQSHFTIPKNTQPGIYALYWVWDFTKLTAVDPSYLELYTSCMDVEIVADDDSSSGNSSVGNSSSITLNSSSQLVPDVLSGTVAGPTVSPGNVIMTTSTTVTTVQGASTVTVTATVQPTSTKIKIITKTQTRSTFVTVTTTQG